VTTGPSQGHPLHSVRRAAVGLVAAVLAVGACTGGDEDAVSVGTVAVRTVSEVVEAPGTVTARASITITAPATGTVKHLAVADGQRVRAGQVVLVIDSPAAEDQLRQAQQADQEAARAGGVSLPGADLSALQRSADAAARRAFAAARKAARLIPDPRQRAAALADLARAEAEHAAARAQAQAAVGRFNAGLGSLAEALSSLSGAQRIQTRAALAVAERTVAALTVRAPIDGVVALGTGTAAGIGGDPSALLGQLPAEAQGQASGLLGGAGSLGAAVGGGAAAGRGPALTEGSPVQSGASLLTITDLSQLSLTADVDETDVLLVRPGVAARVELDAVPGATYDAKVTSVDVSPTTSARGGVSYSVRLSLGGGQGADGDPAPRPRPGMSAVVGLQVRSVPSAVAVPSSAVVRDGNRDTVWVVENGRAERRTVRLGAQGDAFVEVREGVKPGDRVVVRGAERVREGQELP
jgi:HlyD family secretion protein